MVLKDWKHQPKKTLTWYNKKIDKILKIEIYRGRNAYPYQVMLDKQVLKYFDYVGEARIFIENYMRTH